MMLKKFMNLPLIREDKMVLAFSTFKSEAAKFGSRFTQFVTYFNQQWMEKEGPNSFCVFMQPHRTNNLLESYNSNIAFKISPTGCFFKFIELLQSEELIKSRDYTTMMNGGCQVHKKKVQRKVRIYKNKSN